MNIEQNGNSRKSEQWEINLAGNFLLNLYHRLLITPQNDWLIKKSDLRKEFYDFLTIELREKLKEHNGTDNVGTILQRCGFLGHTPHGSPFFKLKSSSLMEFRSKKINVQDDWRINNDVFEKNDKNVQKDVASLIKYWHLVPNKAYPMIFHAVDSPSIKDIQAQSFYNLQELDTVMDYIKDLMYFGINSQPIKETNIGIISSFKSQLKRIQDELNLRKWFNIKTGTMETFQRQEKNIIIMSFVCSDALSFAFMDNLKHINETLALAKSLIILIGNPRILCLNSDIENIYKECQRNNSVIERGVNLKDEANKTFENRNPNKISKSRTNNSIHNDSENRINKEQRSENDIKFDSTSQANRMVSNQGAIRKTRNPKANMDRELKAGDPLKHRKHNQFRQNKATSSKEPTVEMTSLNELVQDLTLKDHYNKSIGNRNPTPRNSKLMHKNRGNITKLADIKLFTPNETIQEHPKLDFMKQNNEFDPFNKKKENPPYSQKTKNGKVRPEKSLIELFFDDLPKIPGNNVSQKSGMEHLKEKGDVSKNLRSKNENVKLPVAKVQPQQQLKMQQQNSTASNAKRLQDSYKQKLSVQSSVTSVPSNKHNRGKLSSSRTPRDKWKFENGSEDEWETESELECDNENDSKDDWETEDEWECDDKHTYEYKNEQEYDKKSYIEKLQNKMDEFKRQHKIRMSKLNAEKVEYKNYMTEQRNQVENYYKNNNNELKTDKHFAERWEKQCEEEKQYSNFKRQHDEMVEKELSKYNKYKRKQQKLISEAENNGDDKCCIS